MGIFQHLLVNCSGRSFTERGGASLKEEGLNWWRRRGFTERGADLAKSRRNHQVCFYHNSDILSIQC